MVVSDLHCLQGVFPGKIRHLFFTLLRERVWVNLLAYEVWIIERAYFWFCANNCGLSRTRSYSTIRLLSFDRNNPSNLISFASQTELEMYYEHIQSVLLSSCEYGVIRVCLYLLAEGCSSAIRELLALRDLQKFWVLIKSLCLWGFSHLDWFLNLTGKWPFGVWLVRLVKAYRRLCFGCNLPLEGKL